MKKTLVFFLSLFLYLHATGQNRIYVTQNGAGDQSGSSWENAMKDIQTAINQVAENGGGEVWVAKGTYYPTEQYDGKSDDSRKKTFNLNSGVKLLGGFTGNETSENERDLENNQTILNGSIDGNNDFWGNSYHVVFIKSIKNNENYFLDGFTISKGSSEKGPALYISLQSEFTSIVLKNSTITDNWNNYSIDGGALHFAAYGENNYLTMVNCLIYGNSESGIHCEALASKSGLTMNNCTVVNNTTGIHVFDENQGTISIVNSIIWGNNTQIKGIASIRYSGIQGGYNGENNIELSAINNSITGPNFMDPANENFRLEKSSVCINRGTNETGLKEEIENDLAGNLRIQNGQMDIGAYESAYSPIKLKRNRIYVCEKESGNKSGSSWENATSDLQGAINFIHLLGGGEVWVAQGTYYPTEQYDGNTFDSRKKSFRLKSNVKLYGNFSGSEKNIEERDLENIKTILNGNIGDKNNQEDNSSHVVYVNSKGDDEIYYLDGFTITDGYNMDIGGAGAYFCINSKSTAIILSNNTIEKNKAVNGCGGGLYYDILGSDGEFTMIHNTIKENLSYNGTGVCYKIDGIKTNTIMISNTISGNQTNPRELKGDYTGKLKSTEIPVKKRIAGILYEATGDNASFTMLHNQIKNNTDIYKHSGNGGGIGYKALGNNSQFHISNNVLTDNYGDGLCYEAYSEDSWFKVNNCTVAKNGYDGIHVKEENKAKVFINNSIFWQNSFSLPITTTATIQYCALGIGFPYYAFSSEGNINLGGRNKDFDGPHFKDPENGDYSLTIGSVCINNGSVNPNMQDLPEKDFAGNDRIQQRRIDIGAYETSFSLKKYRMYVRERAYGDESGSSWENATSDLQEAINTIDRMGGGEVWVAKGTYYPTQQKEYMDIKPYNRSFILANAVKLYGGFVGDEASLRERDIQNNKSILHGGYINSKQSSDEWVETVVCICTNSNNCNYYMDGFTVLGSHHAWSSGDVGASAIDISIGGDSCSVELKNNTITENYSCTILEFSANGKYANLTLTNNEITKNTPWSSSGTNILCFHSSFTDSKILIGNCNIVSNEGKWINNCSKGEVRFLNSIIWNNRKGIIGAATINYCALQEDYKGEGNIELDKGNIWTNNNTMGPNFQDPLNGNFNLTPASPCINKGSFNTDMDNFPEKDLAGNKRIQQGRIDIGAYESPFGIRIVDVWPKAENEIVYGQKLSDVVLTGEQTSVPGKFSFKEGEKVPEVGNGSQTVVFTPEDTENYSSVEGEVKVIVTKAKLEVLVEDVQLHYGDKQPEYDLQYIGFVNGEDVKLLDELPTVTVSGEWPLNVGEYEIVISGGSDNNYEFENGTGTLAIIKAAPMVNEWSIPSKEIVYGQKLSDVVLTEGQATVPGQFAFKEDEKVPGAGSGLQTVVFTPEDRENYSPVEDEVQVIVAKAKLQVSVEDVQLVYGDGQPEYDLHYDGFVNGEGVDVLDELPNASVTGEWPLDAGGYEIVISGVTDDNYDLIFKNGTMSITKADQTISWEQEFELIKVGDEQRLTADASSGLNVVFSSENPEIARIENKLLMAISVGEVLISARQDGNKNYKKAEIKKSIYIDFATGIDDLESNKGDLVVYPNPVQDFVKIKGLKRGQRVVLSSIKGVVIMVKIAECEEMEINLSNYASGIYLLKAEKGRAIRILKI
ncbi:MBG domain-containing protein [Marinifilum fragile]|uniref:MBG domain-containing protein n=1 Tax=Marinifilum fragile TaxID=570161 RepID=UPI002AA84F99|nr:MBG domain-containing protein [Marinifilum fragile]